MNNKWYILVDTDNIAVDYLQLPATWRNVAGLHDLYDEDLATVNEWAEVGGYRFLTLQAAIDSGIGNVMEILILALPTWRTWIRKIRNVLLVSSDVAVATDRWSSYDAVSKRRIAEYRKLLRDITETLDIMTFEWPPLPPELDFLRTISFPESLRLTAECISSMHVEYPKPTVEQVREDQWRRIHEVREQRKYGGIRIEIDGTDYWFWSDEPSRSQYALLYSMIQFRQLPMDYVIDRWKTMNGTFVELTAESLIRIVETGIEGEKILFRVAEEHRQAMWNSSYPASYDYSTGWPDTYYDTIGVDLKEAIKSREPNTETI